MEIKFSVKNLFIYVGRCLLIHCTHLTVLLVGLIQDSLPYFELAAATARYITRDREQSRIQNLQS